MPNYRIYRLRETARQHFRAAPHVSGTASVKRKDYEESGAVDAPHEYAAWQQLRDSPKASKWATCSRPIMASYASASTSDSTPPSGCSPPIRPLFPQARNFDILRQSLPPENSMREARLGDVIDDYCVKCKQIMNHSVVSIVDTAPAKVRCRTC